MIHIAHLGDNHFDETSHRWAECRRIHSWIADDIDRKGVSLTVCSGDIFERRSTIRERAAVAEWLTQMTEVAPMLIVRGNHDAMTPEGGDLALFKKLRTRHPLMIEEAASTRSIDVGGGCMVHVAGVSWPQEAMAKAALERLRGQPLTVDEGHVALGELLCDVLRGLGAELQERNQRKPGPRVLAMHALVTGAITSLGQPLVGDCLAVGLEDLALCAADYIALAHIHKHQSWTVNGAPAVYCGSHFRTSFGEVEPKGYVVATFDTAAGQGCEDDSNGRSWGLIDWKHVETPATPMLLLDAQWDASEARLVISKGSADNLTGAECRLRVSLDSDQREGARAATAELRDRMLADGAMSVKIEAIVRATTRARSPEVARGRTTEEQLTAMWQSKRPELEDGRRAGLLGKLGELRNAL